MINCAFIAPTKYMSLFRHRPTDTQMLLYHLYKNDEMYRAKAIISKGYKILDNSYYELRRTPKLKSLIEAAKVLHADCIVLPDNRSFDLKLIEHVLSYGLAVMLVPTDFEQFIEYVKISMNYRKGLVKVGLGGLHAVNMLSLEDIQYTEGKLNLFHFKNRYLVLRRFERNYPELFKSFMSRQVDSKPRSSSLHFLGLGDYPLAEIKLLLSIVPYATLDSSAFVWSYLKRRRLWYELGKKDKDSKIDFDYTDTPIDDDSLTRYVRHLLIDFSNIEDEETLERLTGSDTPEPNLNEGD